MTAGWVAASTRGSALLRRLVGPAGALEIADAESWADARAQLGSTVYGAELHPDADRAAARRTAATATAWQLRVLAGWCPVGTGRLARLFAAPLEMANIEAHLATMDGAAATPPVSLGSLAVAWPRVAATSTPEQVRAVLSHSAWGDPGGSDPVAIAFGLRVSWARRLVHQSSTARTWAKGGLAVLIARERFAFGRDVAPVTGREIDRLLGNRWRRAATIPELAERVPESGAWALEGIASPAELWRAEPAIVRRAAADATRQAAQRRFTEDTVAAMMALMLVDLWRTTAAIELVGRGPNPGEVFDAVA